MSKKCPQICANCKNFKSFDVDFDYPEDPCGSCKVNGGEVMYGDDEKCENYSQVKHPRVTSLSY
jgi:hypothetical protein